MEIKVCGLNIKYEITGTQGDWVVILQGWGTNLSVYETVAGCIDEKYRVLRFDFPGFGGSEEPAEAWDVNAYTDFFIEFMKAMDIKKATLLGHSYGGRVIIKLFSKGELPFEIKNIVLVDSAGIMPKRSAAQKRKVARYKLLKKIVDNSFVHGLFPDLVEDWKSRQGSEDYRNATPVMRRALVMAVNEDLSDLLPKVTPEVLLIWGDKDTATPIADAKKMEELMPDAGLAVIQGAGHFCFLENPVVFRNIMRSYFKMEGTQ